MTEKEKLPNLTIKIIRIFKILLSVLVSLIVCYISYFLITITIEHLLHWPKIIIISMIIALLWLIFSYSIEVLEELYGGVIFAITIIAFILLFSGLTVPTMDIAFTVFSKGLLLFIIGDLSFRITLPRNFG